MFKHLIFIIFLSLFVFSNPIFAVGGELPECDYTGNPTRPGGECEERVPYVHKELRDYTIGMSCSLNPEIIPEMTKCDYAPILHYPVTIDEFTTGGYINVSYFTDFNDLSLGGWGPSDDSYKSNPADSLAKVYPYSALADKPLDLNDVPREAFRTYWRLSTLHEQLSAKAQFFKRFENQNPPIFDSEFPYIDPTGKNNNDSNDKNNDNPPYPSNTGPNIGYGHLSDKFGEMAAGKPVTFLVSLHWNQDELKKFADLYSKSTYRIVRIIDLQPDTTADIISQAGQNIGQVFNRNTDITVFGNELNAETEYDCGNDLSSCGSIYAPQFIAFHNAVKSTGSPIKTAAAPMNAGHPFRDAAAFLTAARSAYQTADLTAHNVYDVDPAVCTNSGHDPIRCSVESWNWEKQITNTQNKPHIFTEYGLQAFQKDNDLVAVLKFITSGPDHPLVITPLIRNACTSGASGEWLIYDGKQLRDSNGNIINPSTCVIDYATFKISDLIKRLDSTIGTDFDCLRTYPLPNRCGIGGLGRSPEKIYELLDPETKAMYDAFLPFDFDNVRSYIALRYTDLKQDSRTGVLAENIPYVQAINDLLTNSTFSILSAISPSWVNKIRSRSSTEIIPPTSLSASEPLDIALSKEAGADPSDPGLLYEGDRVYRYLSQNATQIWKRDVNTEGSGVGPENGCFIFSPKGPSLPAPSTFPQKLPHQESSYKYPENQYYDSDVPDDVTNIPENSLMQSFLVPVTLKRKPGSYYEKNGKGYCTNGCSPRVPDGFCPDKNTVTVNVNPHPNYKNHPGPAELDTRTKDTVGRAIAVYNNPLQKDISNNLSVGDQSLTGMLMPQGLINPTPTIPLMAESIDYLVDHPDYKVYVNGENTKQGQVARIGGSAEILLCKLRNFWFRPFGLQSGVASDCETPDQFINTTGINETEIGQSCQISGSQIKSNLLQGIISKAASWANVPVGVLTLIVRKEAACFSWNSDTQTESLNTAEDVLCNISDDQIQQYLGPNGAEFPRNCPTGGTDDDADGHAKGPLTFYHNLDTDWGIWRDAIKLATGDTNRVTNVCKIEDSIYAAAWDLSASSGNGCAHPNYSVSDTPPASSWDLQRMQNAVSGFASGCQTPCTHDYAAFYCSLVNNYSNLNSSCQ